MLVDPASVIRSRRCCVAIDKPVKPTDGLDPRGRQRAVASLGSSNDRPLPDPDREKNGVTTALQYGIGQRDARFEPAGHRNHPMPALIKSRMARKQRSGMAIVADTKKRH